MASPPIPPHIHTYSPPHTHTHTRAHGHAHIPFEGSFRRSSFDTIMSSRPTLLLLLLLCLVARSVDRVCLELWDPELCHDGNLTLFPNDGPTDPACLDGSKYGVYFRKSPSASTKWTIFLQGGGWCYNERDCLERSKTSIGSSVHWQQTSGCGCMNIAEDG